LHGIGFAQALVVYAFALAAGLIIPVPIDLGLTLLQRLASSTLTAGISLAGLAALRRHVAAALQTRHGPTSRRIRGRSPVGPR
jgi:hypothetical protein